jgi:hypothetical protein
MMVNKGLVLDHDQFEKIFIYNAILDQTFLETVLEHSEVCFFKNKNIKTVFSVLKNFYLEHKTVPNITELKAHLVTQEQKDALKELILSFNSIDKNYNKNVLIKNT